MKTPVRASPNASTPSASGPNAGPLKMAFDPLRISLFLLTIITVSRIHQHWRFLAVFRPALLLAFMTAVYAFLNPRYLERRGPFHAWPAKVMLALGVFACFAAPFGLSLGGTGIFIIRDYSKTLIFAFLLVAAIRTATDLYTLLWAYVISCGILAWFALFVFGLSKASNDAVERLSNLYTWDANDVGLVIIVGLAFSMLMYQTASRRGKTFAAMVVAGIGATIARSGSRGTFVGLVFFLAALLFMLNQISVAKRLAFLSVIVLGLVVAAPHGYWLQMKTVANPTEDYNWKVKDGRKEVARRGMGYMMEHPIFGLGLHNFWRAECLESQKARSHVLGTGIRCTPPHNSYVEAGAELGLPGLVMWSSLVLGGIIACRRLRRRLPKSWLTGDAEERFLYQSTMYLQLAFIGFAVCAFFLTFAWLDIIYMLAAYLAGLYVAIQEKILRSGSTPQPTIPTRRRRGDPVQLGFITAPQ